MPQPHYLTLSTLARSAATVLFHLVASTVGVAVSAAIFFYSLNAHFGSLRFPHVSLRRGAALTAALFPFQSNIRSPRAPALASRQPICAQNGAAMVQEGSFGRL